MKRIIMVLAVALVMAAIVAVMAAPAFAFSDVQSCQHFYHFFAGAVGNSHCGKGQ